VKAWGGSISVMGIDAGPTGRVAREDFICQACGVGFALENPAKRRFLGCVSLIVLFIFGPFALLMGLGTLVFQRDPAALIVLAVGAFFSCVAYGAWRWMDAPARVYRRNPVVPEAPPPAMRFSALELPARLCRCGASARVVVVTEHESRGIPQGTVTKYCCGACQREFSIDDARGLVTLGVGVVVFLGSASACC